LKYFFFQSSSNLDEIEMLSVLPASSGLQPSSIPSFVVIRTANGTTNGSHIEMTGRNFSPEIKPDNNGQPESDSVLSNDDESILYRSMTIADNQSHY
jgi:hypothetical protein